VYSRLTKWTNVNILSPSPPFFLHFSAFRRKIRGYDGKTERVFYLLES
jgi:hypothetical protein